MTPGFPSLSTTSTTGVKRLPYDMSLRIMLPETDEEAANLPPGLCLLCVAVVSGLTIPAL